MPHTTGVDVDMDPSPSTPALHLMKNAIIFSANFVKETSNTKNLHIHFMEDAQVVFWLLDCAIAVTIIRNFVATCSLGI
jgi:hypothetical protein